MAVGEQCAPRLIIHMNSDETIRRLAEMTDDAAFERLATAVLREANPDYAALVHTGVNADGKTIKSPVDGITFITGAQPPRMIAAHHTTCAPAKLEGKWLHNPASVKPRKGSKPTAPPGDLRKTAAIFAAERTRRSSLCATLILTTNREPSPDVVCNTHAAAADCGIDVDIWSGTRLAHYLDTTAWGQWLRWKHLGIVQERLSRELLAKLSRDSLAAHRPPDDPQVWVARGLDRSVGAAANNGPLFIIAESGWGKSVACYKLLARHIDASGYGLVVPHEKLVSALTLDQAIDESLRQLHPHLAPGAGIDARQLCSAHSPLLLVVEDINKSGRPAFLTEKLASWAPVSKPGESAKPVWRLLCPVWPQVVFALGDESRKRVQALAIVGEPLSPLEGREAVQRRSKLNGRILSDLAADAISEAFGHDPLLIALHEPDKPPQAHSVVEDYIRASGMRLAVTRGNYAAPDYRLALRALAGAMLTHRQLNPRWSDVATWLGNQPDAKAMLGHLVNHGEIIRLDGANPGARLVFRHDRVRDALFADAVAESARSDGLADTVLCDPYFSEVIGAALLHDGVPLAYVERVRARNALALFHALRLFREPANDMHRAVLESIDAWLAEPASHSRQHAHLRFAALAALAETESSHVIALVHKFHERPWTAWQAEFRNGEIRGGLQLCATVEPGTGAAWRDRIVEHAKLRFGPILRRALREVLCQPDLKPQMRSGALRLAGYLAHPQLGEAIEASWIADAGKGGHLEDYLWAAAQCCGDDSERFLGPVCDAWAELSDTPEKEHSASPRDNLAAHNIRWAFQRDVPVSAIPYFLKRGRTEELRWPITYMLHAIDHPDAVEFVVRELAATERRLKGTGHFSPFTLSAPDEWQRRQEQTGRPMSPASRERLLAFWQDQSADSHFREQSFRFWAASETDADLEILRSVNASDALFDKVLWQRLRRKDREAGAALLVKLEYDQRNSWWHLAPLVWSPEFQPALEEKLERRRTQVAPTQGAAEEADYALFQVIMSLSPEQAERLLVRHWDHLGLVDFFVQTALYVATPHLLELARASIDASSDPAKMFTHLTGHYGIRFQGRTGITERRQIEVLIPYLDKLDVGCIFSLWEVCNGFLAVLCG